jgi:undecaprenyl-diphosphatase
MPAASTTGRPAWSRSSRPLHGSPPLTPAGLLLRSPVTVPAIAVAFVVLAALALIAHSAVPHMWDRPIQHWVEDQRTDRLDDFFLFMSQFGGTQVVVVGSAILLGLVWRRCRPLFLLLLGATLARPALEWTLKAFVDRDRPDFDRLVGGNGPSFPSGHVMAAVALWGLVPPVVALLTRRRFWWWVATVASAAMIIIVAASRVYLGVHWFSDVVAALLLGSLYLLVVEWCFDRAHRRYPCAFLDRRTGPEREAQLPPPDTRELVGSR